MAQRLARMVWDHEVAGSNPATPTIDREFQVQRTWFPLEPKSEQIGKNAHGPPGAGSQLSHDIGHQTPGIARDIPKVPGQRVSPQPSDGVQ